MPRSDRKTKPSASRYWRLEAERDKLAKENKDLTDGKRRAG